MDNQLEIMASFDTEEFFNKLNRYDDLSYRRYKRLPKKQKKILKEYQLFPEMVNLTLKVFSHIKKEYNNPNININFAVNISSIIFSNYMGYKIGKTKNKNLSDKVLKAELEFRGFIKLKDHTFEKEVDYVCSIRRIGKHYYIHPFKMSCKNIDYPNTWVTWHKFDLANNCRLLSCGVNQDYLPIFTTKEKRKINKESSFRLK